jgi:hypothetical protein
MQQRQKDELETIEPPFYLRPEAATYGESLG